MSRKKIGILTFHNADNLGAVLQAYALQTTLEKKYNCPTEVIDYLCNEVEATKKVKINSIKGICKAIPLKCYYFIKHRGFKRFRKEYLVCSEKSYTKNTINNCIDDYDIFITGSDQIWNLECSGYDDTYFLDFVPENKKRYSYAASIGNYKYKSNEQKHINDLLSRFNSISVRENSAIQKLKEMGVSDIAVHSDPVILLDSGEWKSVMGKRIIKDNYVFVYLIQEDVNVIESAQAYAKKYNLKVIINKKSPEFILHGSPQEFLSWIYFAESVFTNSFHATAFSLIFNKKLGADVELRDGRTNNRILELLNSVEAENCILRKDNIDVKAGYNNELFLDMRRNAFEYLNSICMNN